MKTGLRVFLLPVAISLALGACSTTAPYQRPDIDLPPSYRGASSGISGGRSVALIPYGEFFADAVLVSLLDDALAHNYDLQYALKNIDYAAQSLRQAKLGVLPTIELNASGTLNRPSDNSLSGSSIKKSLGQSYSEDYSLSLSTSWEADIWGKIRNRKKGALAGYLKTV